MGKRLMKRSNLMAEVEKSIEDKIERGKVLEGLLGYILSSTQVLILFILQMPASFEFENRRLYIR